MPATGSAAVAMDQRNPGRSGTGIRADHGWHTYAGDHLALMDHLGFDHFHVLGGCIGGSFCLKVVETVPQRVTAAGLRNPTGVEHGHLDYFPQSHAEWSQEQRTARPELDAAAIGAFGHNIWDHDFVFSVDRMVARACPVPTYLLPGSDVPRFAATSAELAALLPGVKVLTDWRGPE